MIILIDRLGPIYEEATGEPVGRSTDPKTERPIGPFVRFMRGVCDLGGIAKTDEGIATSIRHYKTWFNYS